MTYSLRIHDIVDTYKDIYVSFLPIAAEGNENSFHCFCKLYKHGNDGSFP